MASLQMELPTLLCVYYKLIFNSRDQVIPHHMKESWVGLRYHQTDHKWHWSDGEIDMVRILHSN